MISCGVLSCLTHSLDDCVGETCRLPSQLVGLTSVKMLAIPTVFQKHRNPRLLNAKRLDSAIE